MQEDTTGRICQLHVRLEERVDQIDKRLWRTRYWLIYIAFISFVGSFLGSYAGRQWSLFEALSERDKPAGELEHRKVLEQNEQDRFARPLVAGRL